MKVAINIGHIPAAKGASGYLNGKLVTEFDFNSKLAPQIAEKLNELGYETILIWEDHSLRDVVEKANASFSDVCVALHLNAFNKIATGTEVLHYIKSIKGKKLASLILHELTQILNLPNRGTKELEYSVDRKDRGAYLVKYTAMPCVIVESGFIDNESNLRVLTTCLDNGTLAQAIADGIYHYLTTTI